MRLNIANDSIEEQVAAMRRELDELKTPQLTSQNSGMLAYLVRSGLRDDFGDIVYFSTSNNQTVRQISHILLPNTGNLYNEHTLTCDQTFVPKHNKPAVVVPILELEVNTNGYHGKSEYFANNRGYGVKMDIFNSANAAVGSVFCSGILGELFMPQYDSTSFYKYHTSMTVAATVSDVELAYHFTVRSSDKGTTSSTLRGTW